MISKASSDNDDLRISQPTQGTWRTYDVTDGLPGGVLCLLQDRHGYLWLGTEAGLCRYDGAEFIAYTTDDGLAGNHVQAICEDRQGRLWIGTGWCSVAGKGVSCYDGTGFTNYTTEDGLADNHVMAVYEDRNGRLWLGTLGGLSCYDGRSFVTYTTDHGLPTNRVSCIHEDTQGRLWFGNGAISYPGYGVACYDGMRFTTYTTSDGLPSNHVYTICSDSLGRLWFGGWRHGATCYDGTEFINYTTDEGLADSFVRMLYNDAQGRLWIGTHEGGVSCLVNDEAGRGHTQSFITYTADENLLSNGINDIAQDREGNLWFAHEFSGLSRLDPNTLELLTNEPISSEVLNQDKQGNLWFGNGKDLCRLSFRENSSVSDWNPQRQIAEIHRRAFNMHVSSILEDSTERFWIGTWDGLYCYDSLNNLWNVEGRHFAAKDGLDITYVWALLEANDGTIWIGTDVESDSLYCYDGKEFRAIPVPRFTIQHRLFEDSRGCLWIGGWRVGGLSCYDREKLVTYTEADGLPDERIGSVLEDSAGNLWIGTGQGLCRFDGKSFFTYGREQALSDFYHQCSAKSSKGELWFGTLAGGIYRYDGRHFQQLTTKDGLPSNTIRGLVPQPDGSMIIGTSRGIVRYRPTATAPPRIEIQEVVADRVYRNPAALELTVMQADLLTISYHGLSLATLQMRYSYILEGYDQDWRDTWENSIRYEKLPIGEYTFRVIAINRDLVCSEEPATLRLSIKPDPMLVSMQAELNYLRSEAGRKYQFGSIIGHSAAIMQVRGLMEKAIESRLAVLITGETGTGKELVAKAIHHNSPRKDRPLLAMNCGAIPRELLASELFGHHRGAFTGAREDKMGLFEAASGGTVILDEISEMPEDAQVHLLRVLEERVVQRLGEHISRDVDVRVIAIANKDLMKEVSEGRFREDLYYRLSVFPIHVPPLRERIEDIPPLAEHFLQDVEKELDGFAPDVFQMLQSYSWPGNVRELRNAVHRAAALAEERIQTYHFPPEITRGESLIQDAIASQSSYSDTVNYFQRRFIEQVLRECQGNRHEAARRLQMHRPNLLRLMKKLGIS